VPSALDFEYTLELLQQSEKDGEIIEEKVKCHLHRKIPSAKNNFSNPEKVVTGPVTFLLPKKSENLKRGSKNSGNK
jgi:hypothetical protein